MRKVKTKVRKGFIIVTDYYTDEELLVTESYIWFTLFFVYKKWTK